MEGKPRYLQMQLEAGQEISHTICQYFIITSQKNTSSELFIPLTFVVCDEGFFCRKLFIYYIFYITPILENCSAEYV